jgi:hypothetical protein
MSQDPAFWCRTRKILEDAGVDACLFVTKRHRGGVAGSAAGSDSGRRDNT